MSPTKHEPSKLKVGKSICNTINEKRRGTNFMSGHDKVLSQGRFMPSRKSPDLVRLL